MIDTNENINILLGDKEGMPSDGKNHTIAIESYSPQHAKLIIEFFEKFSSENPDVGIRSKSYDDGEIILGVKRRYSAKEGGVLLVSDVAIPPESGGPVKFMREYYNFLKEHDIHPIGE